MKSILLAITFAAAGFAFAESPGQKNIIDVLGRPDRSADPAEYCSVWMDSQGSYTARFYDIQNDGKPSFAGDTIYFLGGTLHEGGLEFKIKVRDDDGWMSVPEDAHPFKKDDRMEYRKLGGDELLLFRDAVSGAVKDVLRKQKGKEKLHELVIRNLRELGLEGRYQGPKGEVHFLGERNGVSGLWFLSSTNVVTYKFAEEFGDTPTLTVIAIGQAYGVKKTLMGLELTPMKADKEAESGWMPDESKDKTTLTKITGAGYGVPVGQYPLISHKIFTKPELKFYAGAPLAENLKIMRNEIFARHGYKFQGALREHFDAQLWYKPEHDDVTDRLSEIEQINISLIKALEKKAKEDSADWIPYF